MELAGFQQNNTPEMYEFGRLLGTYYQKFLPVTFVFSGSGPGPSTFKQL
jgi:hypothetical protein